MNENVMMMLALALMGGRALNIDGVGSIIYIILAASCCYKRAEMQTNKCCSIGLMPARG